MANNLLSSVWSTIGSVCLAILILLIMITIHEFGHYIAGKIFKFKINEFSIGFGPALFKRKNKKTGELFAVRCIPLGGYCAFEGEDGLEEEPPAQKRNEKEQTSPVFEEDGFSDQQTETVSGESVKQPDPNAFTQKPCWQRIIVLIAGALMNYLLALLLIITCFFCYGQTMIAVYRMQETTGEYIGYSFENEDILLKADGKNLYLTTDVVSAVNGKKQGDLVEFTVSRIVGTETVVENGEESAKNVREIMTVTIMLRADVSVKNSTQLESAWEALGILYDEGNGGYQLANSIYKFGFWETLGRSFVYSFKIAGSILKVLGELLTGKLGLSAFGGPVTTVAMTSEIVSRGFRYFLEIAGYIGVNLAVFNLLPIPALDGCKVLFTLIEWIRGKPISRKVEAIVNAAGFIFLLGFAVLVDILQFV